jgi:hypothetical protein
MSIEAMKQGLEALEIAQDNLRPHEDNCFLHDEGEYNRCFCGKDSLSNFLQEQVESLSQAIARAEHLEAEKQEPVAYVHRNEYNEYRLEPTDNFKIEDLPVGVEVMLYPRPQPKREPDYSICPTCGGMAGDPIVPPEQRQPKREWVGLTQNQINRLCEMSEIAAAVVATELLLKEKNHV